MSSTSHCSKCSAPLQHLVLHGLCETCHVISTQKQDVDRANTTQTYLQDVGVACTITAPGGLISQGHTKSKQPTELFDDRYEIHCSLGSGGMGEVWKAFDRNTERFVAIKYIKSAQFQAIEYNRFLTEARAMANLKHTNVLGLYDFSVDQQRPYMVLEFVDGQSLAVTLGNFKKSPLAYREVARIMEAAARGVQSAHDSQVLHRDIKPSNIMLAKDGTVKVLDFGLAKRTTESGSQLTLMNTMVGGTPGFTAPEQVRPEGITTPRTDVWGLGATLYALLAGIAPFPTGSENFSKVLTEPLTPLRNRRLGIPADLEAVAMKCLEKNPEDRYATATDVAEELGRYQRGEPVDAKKVTLTERVRCMAKAVPRSTWLVLLIAAVVAASGASLAMLPKRTLQESEQDDLRSGRPVTIIGTEHPEGRTFRSFFELNSLGKSVVAGSGSSLLAQTVSLCELSTDPGCAQYFLQGEFQYRMILAAKGQPSKIGLYFDHHITKLEQNCTLMTFYSVSFQDYDEKARLNDEPPHPTAAIVRHHAIHIDNNGKVVPQTRQLFAKRFVPSIQMPTPYRKIVVEVQPDLFRFWWNCEATEPPTWVNTRPRIDKDYAVTMSSPDFKGLVQSDQDHPGWSPRHGIGLYCEGAQLGVRNFILTPAHP
jgi:serine/threonine protein kinase